MITLEMHFLFALFLLQSWVVDTIKSAWPDTVLVLNAPLSTSVLVTISGENWEDFKISADTLYIFNVPEDASILVTYRRLKIHRVYALFEPDTGTNDTQKLFYRYKKLPERRSKVFPEGITVAGAKSISVSLRKGNLELDQATSIEIRGTTPSGLSVAGILRDRNLGEGLYFTEEISRIEQTYLEVKKNSLTANLGDFSREIDGIPMKLRGAGFELKKKKIEVTATYGYERGEFNTVSFYGENGKQGPYKLTGKSGATKIHIVPGTERVYVNGVLMKRGLENDYVIDYENATITFTPSRPITSDDLITVDFQYRGQLARKHFRHIKAVIKKGVFNVEVAGISRGDDEEYLRDYLTKSELQILDSLGDTMSCVFVSGAKYVGPGKGDYVKEDSVFKFVGFGNGDYQVNFTYFGSGKGSYTLDPLSGHYTYVGPGNGEYEPLVEIEIPQRNENYDVKLGLQLKNGGISLETGLSSWKRNILSHKSIEKRGLYQRFSLDKGINVNRSNRISVSFLIERQDSSFVPFGRSYDPVFWDNWNLAYRTGMRRILSQLGIQWQGKFLNFSTGLGYLEQGNEKVRRGSILFGLKLKKFLGSCGIALISHAEERAVFTRLTAKLSYSGFISPFLQFKRESADTLDFLQIKGGITSSLPLSPSISLTFQRETGETLRVLNLGLKRDALRGFSIDADLSCIFRNSDTLDEKFGLVGLNWSFTGLSGYVSGNTILSTSGRKRWQERFIYVGEGRGNYSYNPESGTFYECEDGEYAKEIIQIEDAGSGYNAKNTLAFRIKEERTGELSGECSLNFSFPTVLSPLHPTNWDNMDFSMQVDWRRSISSTSELSLCQWITISKQVAEGLESRRKRLSTDLSMLFEPNFCIGIKGEDREEFFFGFDAPSTSREIFLYLKRNLELARRLGTTIIVSLGMREKSLPHIFPQYDVLKSKEISLGDEMRWNPRGFNIYLATTVTLGFVNKDLPSSPLLYPMGKGLAFRVTGRISRKIGRNTQLSFNCFYDSASGAPPAEVSMTLGLAF